MHKLDHIVLGSSTLEEGTEFVENILQAKLSDIGYHKDMGTHNRVIRISERVYLEVIAIDPKISNLNNRKWFNLDDSSLNHSQISKFLMTYNGNGRVLMTNYGIVSTMMNDSQLGTFEVESDGTNLLLKMTKSSGTGTVRAKIHRTIL